jgi:hypothetical protein
MANGSRVTRKTAKDKYKVKPSSNAKHRNSSQAKKNTRQAIRNVQDIENIYYTKEKRFAELSKYMDSGRANLQLQEERDKLSNELSSLGESLISSEEDLYAQLKEDGSWKAKLIGYWWRSWRPRRY